MSNKMAPRVLTYKLGLPRYGDSKLEKCKNFTKKIVLKILSLVNGKRVFLDAAKNDTIFSSNYW